MLTTKLADANPDLSFAENTDELFVRKRLFMGCPHVADEDITNMGRVNQRGACHGK